MNFGYLIIISNEGAADYFRMAEALCYSIKATQKPGYDKVALVADDLGKIRANGGSTAMFDHVVEWNNETFWYGRSYMDMLTPFDHTVCLDADMLFLEDCSIWIDFLINNVDLYCPSDAYTYRNDIVKSDYYRKTFTANDIPNLYSFFTFFKKDKTICDEFFELARLIIKNPQEFSSIYLSKRKPKLVGTDEAFGLAAKILGIEDQISFKLDFPRIVHLKSGIQNWNLPVTNVSDLVGLYFNEDAKLKIGNYQQNNIVHYVEKDFIDDSKIEILRKKYYESRSI
jgi:hypothetical protein